LDNVGRDMFHGGGRMVIAAGDRVCGPGHFGRTIIDEGVEVMSCHYEADFNQSGRSVLGIRPLLWRNGWPVAGNRFRGGNFAITSERRGYSLELAVDFVRIQQERESFWRIDLTKPVEALPEQKLADVAGTWPAGAIAVRAGDYMFRPHQRWTITPRPDGGGYLGNCYFSITISGTDRALAATANLELTTQPQFTGDDSQLWRIEQLTDGTYRIMPKAIPGQEGINTRYCIYSAGDSTPTLAPYDFSSDNSKWNFYD
jgi:arabinan endo-1,5-alpha-L-arabinosidase